MSQRKKILLSAPVPEELVEELKRSFDVVVGSSADRVDPDGADQYKDLAGWLTTVKQPVGAELLDRLPELEVVSNFAVGYDNIDVPAATERGVLVCNTPGVLNDAVATLTIGMIIGVARRIAPADRHVREGWSKPFPLSTDLHGKVLGILGMGRIGAKVARIAQAIGMSVIYHNRTRDEAAEAEGLASYRDRDALIAESDFVSLHLPLTEESRGSFGADDFRRMKPTAYLINTARGAVVDEQALIEALRSGEIAGAALDVFEQEPLPADSPLIELDNALLQPHVGSGTVETRRAMIEMAVRNLTSVLDGRSPQSAVNTVAVQG